MSFSKPHRHRLEGDDYKEFAEKIFHRDGWRCRNPFCGSSSSLTVHHLKKRSQLGDDDPGNCLTLCVKCHDLVERNELMIEVVNVVVKFFNQGGDDADPEHNS